MSNITKFYAKDAAKDPDVVLEQAEGVYEKVLVLGWDKDGQFDPRASTNTSLAECVLLANQAIRDLVPYNNFTEEDDD